MRKVVAGIVVAGIVGATGYYFLCSGTGDTAVVVGTEFVQPERRRMTSTVLATGTIRLRVGAEVRVGSQMSGIVRALHVNVGSHVTRGDVIAEIDSQSLNARLEQARAQQVLVEVEMKRAEIALARSRALRVSDLVPRQQTEDLELAVESARAQLEKARRDVSAIEVDLSYVAIRAPISGIVASVSTQQGETVAASFNAPTFVTIIEDGALELIGMVDETDIGQVRLGQPVTFTVEAFPTREYEGTVTRIAPKATIVSGVVNYEVAMRLKTLEHLRPDMTANIGIHTARREGLVIPASAMVRDGDKWFVWISRNDTLVKQPVTIGVREGPFVEVTSGVSSDTRVAVSPPSESGQ